MSRRRASSLVALTVCFAVLTSASADAAQITGVSDQNMVGWDAATNSVYGRMNLPQVRYITAWDVALHKNDNPCSTPCQRFREAGTWIAKARSQGKTVLVSFSDKVGCNGCVPPTSSQYASGVSAFLSSIPTVNEFTAWNEPNHKTHVAASLAAQYWKLLNQYCHPANHKRSCTVAGGDLSDDGNYLQYTQDYKSSLSALGAAPGIWSIHAYGAVNGGSFGTLLDWMNNYTSGKPIWITEVGALYCHPTKGLEGATPEDALNYQNSRAEYLNSLLQQVPARVQRTYYYFLAKPAGQQESCPGFDSALVGANDFQRPALATLFPNLVSVPSAPSTRRVRQP
jgi:hypothetical protein